MLDDDGEVVTDAEVRANMFNSYFATVFVKDNGLQPKWVFPISTEEVTDVEFSPQQVYAHLSSLPSKTSSGPDGFPAIFLKRLSLVLAQPLAIIYQLSFATSKLPFDWLGANIVPVYKKKGNPNLCSLYRPISLTPYFCKNQESMIYVPLLEHLKPYLHAGQHGFLKGWSTVTQLLECLRDWTSAIDSSKFVDVLYVDISKAFDSVSHPKLIAKLDRYGVRGHLLLWIKAFQADRRQRVVVD
ncbi:MAG: hypothetical protein GY858_08195, partial [Candidatus Omnitrophica bacterium]|nr:hypothetical protein [Candidatus Omnitrophota bacterium]